jgi:hypothetical protein
MRAAFIAGFLLSLAGVLALAVYAPWISHPRLASLSQVVPNGGRAERFLIRLPADQIATTGTADLGLRGSRRIGDLGLNEAPWLSEQFKVRDADGNVIGVASRHWTELGEGPVVAWAIVIPSRGALLLGGAGEARESIDGALRRAGYAADAWSGDVEVGIGDRARAGRVLAGTEEFGGLAGDYRERWLLSGVVEDGSLRGTIELDTVTYRAP